MRLNLNWWVFVAGSGVLLGGVLGHAGLGVSAAMPYILTWALVLGVFAFFLSLPKKESE
jgi:hypothetical protein